MGRQKAHETAPTKQAESQDPTRLQLSQAQGCPGAPGKHHSEFRDWRKGENRNSSWIDAEIYAEV